MAFDAEEPPSSFDKLRMRAIFSVGALGNLILSLSKDEVSGQGRGCSSNLASCPLSFRPVTSVHGFDRFLRAAMAQLQLTPTAASCTRPAPPRVRHTAFDIQG
ncbi:hypothetical protein [Caulobacter soli]|uniref:hypothetical protein n=1 Tax=Caulobacter soli TaxID=2708539 RepID=UPI0013E9A1E3|nr:hypothetical protein [Caulobacter soli]